MEEKKKSFYYFYLQIKSIKMYYNQIPSNRNIAEASKITKYAIIS